MISAVLVFILQLFIISYFMLLFKLAFTFYFAFCADPWNLHLAPFKVEEDEEEEVVEVVEEDKLEENDVKDEVEESISESVAVVEAKVEIDEPSPSAPSDETKVVTEGETDNTNPSVDLEADKIQITILET